MVTCVSTVRLPQSLRPSRGDDARGISWVAIDTHTWVDALGRPVEGRCMYSGTSDNNEHECILYTGKGAVGMGLQWGSWCSRGRGRTETPVHPVVAHQHRSVRQQHFEALTRWWAAGMVVIHERDLGFLYGTELEETVNHQCTVSAPSVRGQCTVSAQSVHRHGAITAPSHRHQCAISAPSLHHQCAITAPSLHHHCTSSGRRCGTAASAVRPSSSHRPGSQP